MCLFRLEGIRNTGEYVNMTNFAECYAMVYAPGWTNIGDYAIPANAIVLLSLRSAWRDFRWNQILISVIVWGSILSLYLSLLVFANINVWKLFLLGIPGQIAVLLWFRLYRKNPKEESNG